MRVARHAPASRSWPTSRERASPEDALGWLSVGAGVRDNRGVDCRSRSVPPTPTSRLLAGTLRVADERHVSSNIPSNNLVDTSGHRPTPDDSAQTAVAHAESRTGDAPCQCAVASKEEPVEEPPPETCVEDDAWQDAPVGLRERTRSWKRMLGSARCSSWAGPDRSGRNPLGAPWSG